MGASCAIWLLIVAVLSWFFTSDPLELSSLSGLEDFRAQYVAAPKVHTILPTTTHDSESRSLQASSEIVGDGAHFEPETPPLGLSDAGRTTSAITTNNRSAMCEHNNTPGQKLDHEHMRIGELCIADACYGISKVGTQGGLD
ncbi:hypothetical protein M758_12G070700 [Ceratodon purpureus]|nr:hypothetical protein M758_12G070700 [Ceratodon purpureus]